MNYSVYALCLSGGASIRSLWLFTKPYPKRDYICPFQAAFFCLSFIRLCFDLLMPPPALFFSACRSLFFLIRSLSGCVTITTWLKSGSPVPNALGNAFRSMLALPFRSAERRVPSLLLYSPRLTRHLGERLILFLYVALLMPHGYHVPVRKAGF
jgi:hypothetical protein